MNPVIAKLHEAQLRKDLPEFRPGDTVRVNVRLKEGEGEKEKERLQAFEGVVISKKGRASGATFTVRRVSFGVGIERIFPLHSPTISSIEVVGKGKVRRARLYYLRDLRGKAARIKRAAREEEAPVAAAAAAGAESRRRRVFAVINYVFEEASRVAGPFYFWRAEMTSGSLESLVGLGPLGSAPLQRGGIFVDIAEGYFRCWSSQSVQRR